jgi:hypothetical protein
VASVRIPAAPLAGSVVPRLTLVLLSFQHALIHGQSALYPLVYLGVIDAADHLGSVGALALYDFASRALDVRDQGPARNPQVNRTMSGPTEWHVIGTRRCSIRVVVGHRPDPACALARRAGLTGRQGPP